MTDTAATYRGLYINLDRSPERRARIEQQLATFGLEGRYQRFPGIDGKALHGAGPLQPGELGAFHAHTRALEEARGFGTPVHILEDDAVLSEHVRPVIEDATVSGLFGRYDILFTDTLLAPHLGMLKTLKAIFDTLEARPRKPLRVADLQTIDLAGENFSCLTSYIVAPRAMERLIGLLKQEIAVGPKLPVDLFVRDCIRARKLSAACLFPFVTSLDLDAVARSTIAPEARRNPSVMVLSVLRYGFFIGRDLARAQRYLDAAMSGSRSPRDAHHALIVQALDFVMSDDFKEF